MELDLKSQVSVRSFVDQFLAKNVPLNILVHLVLTTLNRIVSPTRLKEYYIPTFYSVISTPPPGSHSHRTWSTHSVLKVDEKWMLADPSKFLLTLFMNMIWVPTNQPTNQVLCHYCPLYPYWQSDSPDLPPIIGLIVVCVQVNNAGATLGTPWYTDQGIGGSAQVLFGRGDV